MVIGAVLNAVEEKDLETREGLRSLNFSTDQLMTTPPGMSLLKSASTIAGSSVISQLIGALSIWLISHKYDMAEVGLYALNYSIAVVGAQVCTFASQLLIPKQHDDELVQNVVFCLIQSTIIALPYAVLTAWLFHQNILFLYLLTLATAWVLISKTCRCARPIFVF